MGQWLHQQHPIKIKKHGRRAKSIFRLGFDFLRSIAVDLDLKHREFLHSLQLIFVLYLVKSYLILNL